ncbi:pentapeptide repeat-containing protein [Methylocapsa acidiphila]|uniref:pentapeptide repeat-containing protein n=1 Tax=Methylocapsa acidiphila TaxID=133552 RepID=UPI00047B3898|nr:pentapeptide repeat-containing protein [Methylocapsa acidiphila]
MSELPTKRPQSTELVHSTSPMQPSIPRIARLAFSHKKFCSENWKNSDFKDFNALGAEFENCDFSYSNFERAYFRDAKFTNCRFIGARFMDCNLKGANFYKCDLKFARFQRCLIDVRELMAALPSEPNIRREALQNLKANAVEVGDYASQSLLVLQEIEATKRHYKYAITGFDTYYLNKYSTFISKFEASIKLIWLEIGGLIWGHGEKPWRLLISCFMLLSIYSLVNFWSVMPRVGWGESLQGLREFEYIIRLFLDMSPDKNFSGYIIVDYLVVVMRFVYIGLFISVLYKSISHR